MVSGAVGLSGLLVSGVVGGSGAVGLSGLSVFRGCWSFGLLATGAVFGHSGPLVVGANWSLELKGLWS
jgi:hypothetical protein